MALSKEELKEKILEKALSAPKPQLYVKDFYKCDPESKPLRSKMPLTSW
ncbi:MAG: hypothetical protein OEL66_06495 [Desulfobulbaceae bacterium]|nr:hypothetical protein [Desulfobulbaceae bacterium]